MQPTSHQFHENTRLALKNMPLQKALESMESGLALKRKLAVEKLPEFETLWIEAKKIKDHTFLNLDQYLLEFERNAMAAGSQVHWAKDKEEANQIILKITADAKAHMITKGKSMASEEIGLNQALEKAGYLVQETDLGEYIIQLRQEQPSHIIAPAIHVLQEEVEDIFRKTHQDLPKNRQFPDGQSLVREAREVLRHRYQQAIVGITGANFLIASTGQSVIVTNEGNGDLTQHLANVHIVLAGIDKIIPNLDDTSLILRLLARSATGQELSSYTTFSLGSRRDGEIDGPKACHIVLLDNGRSDMLANEFKDMLRCIRCSACMNVCPVYRTIGGHAYGWVYPGPMGSVLTPNFIGLEHAVDLPNASSLCGRCAEVCPMKIPLPDLLRKWRNRAHQAKLTPVTQRFGLRIWVFLASHPWLYQKMVFLLNFGLRLFKSLFKREYLTHIPFGIAKGRSQHRTLPLPSTPNFMSLYKENPDYEP